MRFRYLTFIAIQEDFVSVDYYDNKSKSIKEFEMKNYTSLRKKCSKIIIFLIYITTVCYILGQSQSITNWNYTFHEMLFLPYNLAYYSLPVLSLIWIYYGLRSIKEKSKEKNDKRKLYFKNIVIILSIVLIAVYFNYESHGVSTSGVFTIEEKIYDGEKYNIVVNGISIKCTWNEYNLIRENNEYLLSFNWNEYSPSPSKGKLEYCADKSNEFKPIWGDDDYFYYHKGLKIEHYSFQN